MVFILDGNAEIGAHIRQSLLFDLFKTCDKIERNHKSDFYLTKILFPSCVRNMFFVTI